MLQPRLNRNDKKEKKKLAPTRDFPKTIIVGSDRVTSHTLTVYCYKVTIRSGKLPQNQGTLPPLRMFDHYECLACIPALPFACLLAPSLFTFFIGR